ncbi:unnamed protein product [Auanema sp. JU1783]|nr:unnamed protein product [Auanema sp. JU1783]
MDEQRLKRSASLTNLSDPEVKEVKEEPIEENDEEVLINKIGEIDNVPLVFSPIGERYNTLRYLEEKKPTAVILYNSDLSLIRQLEIYKALNDKLHFVVHQVQYSNSTEEERYLTAVNNETRAFESILREKATLLIPRTWDVTRDEPPTLNVNTRDLGAPVPEGVPARPLIVVDMREFNSELPTILYKKGFEVAAATLEIGDYVLTPGVSVERKALDDLTQSLQSGRVFKQIEQMLEHYPNTFLLIESNRKFEAKIVNGGPFQGELTRYCRDIRALLCSLVRAQPKMKLLWSISPENTAEYFAELKISRDQPDVEKAVSLRSGDAPAPTESGPKDSKKKSKPNAQILRSLSSSLEGVAKGDVTSIMLNNEVTCLKDLFTFSSQKLHSTIGTHADKLYNLAHFDFSQSST